VLKTGPGWGPGTPVFLLIVPEFVYTRLLRFLRGGSRVHDGDVYRPEGGRGSDRKKLISKMNKIP
jgi:hypothetical protein